MPKDLNQEPHPKPLAGTCQHEWRDQEAPFVVAQLCLRCRLFRYKSSATADWEYRAPIPIGRVRRES
jgi:hypothetical protein